MANSGIARGCARSARWRAWAWWRANAFQSRTSAGGWAGSSSDSLAAVGPEAAMAQRYVQQLRAACDREGNLPAARRHEVGQLVTMLERRLE